MARSITCRVSNGSVRRCSGLRRSHCRRGRMQVLGNGRFLELVRDEHGWEYARRVNATGVVVIAASTDKNEVILIEQYRPPVGARVVELPAGLVGDDVPDEAMELA